MNETLAISIVIPTYNRGTVLCEAIARCLNQDHPAFEVIVVDQSPALEQPVREYLESVRSRIRYFALPEPNVSAARNFGVRQARFDIVAFIDDDLMIECDYLSCHARHYLDAKVGGVMALTIESGETKSRRELVRLAAREYRAKVNIEDQPALPVEWATGCNTSYRKSAIIRAGWSDPAFLGCAWCEDADLAVRVRGAGYLLIFDSTFAGIHLALPRGGCGNRDVRESDRKHSERVILSLYHVAKNWKLLGLREAWERVYLTYRGFALNYTLARTDWRKMVRRQVVFLRLLSRVIGFRTGRRPALWSTSEAVPT